MEPQTKPTISFDIDPKEVYVCEFCGDLLRSDNEIHIGLCCMCLRDWPDE